MVANIEAISNFVISIEQFNRKLLLRRLKSYNQKIITKNKRATLKLNRKSDEKHIFFFI